jgi:ubiquitin C-terminal hydrolase
MNSILAVLQQTPIFADYILTAQFKDQLLSKYSDVKEISDSILFQLYNILNISHTYDNYNINPDTFRKTITKKNEMWGYQQHQDSQEFLTFLLNSIEEEIAEKVIFIPGNIKSDRNISDRNINDVETNLPKGLWPAIEEFLYHNKNWVIWEKKANNNGLTVLKRIY